MRLTERMEDGSYEVKQCLECIWHKCESCKHLTKAIQRLGELEDIEHGISKKSRDFGK